MRYTFYGMGSSICCRDQRIRKKIMDIDRFEKQKNFIMEIDKEKNISRRTHLSCTDRAETDSEHAWHMAVMAWLLSEYSNEKIDLLKTIMMILTHDLVEIYAGDTYAYDKAGKATEKERELKAADKIYSMLPKDQAETLRALWEEFEQYETPEARFAHVMDNFQPMLLNDSNMGNDWAVNGIGRSQVEKRNEKTASGSKEIWEYMQAIIKKNIERGSLKDK